MSCLEVRQTKERAPVAMVKEMADKFRKSWTPNPEEFVVEEDEEVTEPWSSSSSSKPPCLKKLSRPVIFVAIFLTEGSASQPRSVAD